ncbi:unnamed protein product [Brachionus calyciflorus]|uniref:Calponin-homology (CH) domain-containing protein n=1 Tax=Brachionus calyciflorus TaxID=104777 RepID=A0A813MM30_9BILA|nr:unnamed protein product [Brachionus calyciflorus]
MSVLNTDKTNLNGDTNYESDSFTRNQPYFHQRLNINTKNKYQQMATIRNLDDKWIQIQKNTFTNWVNEQLKFENETINDLKTDFANGVKLIKLVNILQQPNSKVNKRYFKNPTNQHQSLENINLALNAITDDGIKLVNIGNVDLMSGNLKLILGLIWHLILRYQIGKTKIPPKKLILAWIKSVLPQYKLTNLTNDLNDGLILAGIINYCRSDLFPDWLGWSRKNNLENCTKAMNVANEEFGIPMVVTPQNMSSPELDELSAITYLSYFIREGSPGYKATLKWIHSYIPDEEINNFSTDWNDGWLLCKLAYKMGINVAGFPNLDRTKKEQNCKAGLEACKELKIETYVTAKELSDSEVESIAVMATVVQFKYTQPLKSINEKAKIFLEDSVNDAIVGKPFNFRIEYLESECKNIKTYAKGPKSSPAVGTERQGLGNLKCHFIPGETGVFELNVVCDDNSLDGCPIIINVKPDTNKIQLIANEKNANLYQPIEICIDPRGAGRGKVIVTSKSPSGEEISSKVDERLSKYYALIFPNEIGNWETKVLYDNEEVSGSPYLFQAFDPNAALITGISSNSTYQINKKISFQVDVSRIGEGKFHCQLINLRNNESYPIEFIESEQKGLYDLHFTPLDPGQYRCSLLFNNKHINELDERLEYYAETFTVMSKQV